MADYKIELYRDGVLKAELIETISLQWGYIRNGFVDGRLIYSGNKLDPEVRANLIEGSEIRIFRRGVFDSTRKLIYAGEIKDPQKSVDSKNVKKYDIKIEAWGNVFFKKRRLTASFVSEQEQDIAWGLIDQTQTDTKSGAFTADEVDFGIRQGTLEGTVNTRTKSYSNDVLLTALRQLADLEDNGTTQYLRGFRLSPDLLDPTYHVFSYYRNYGEVRKIIYTNENIQSVKEVSTYPNYLNRIIGTGGQGTTPQEVNSVDPNVSFYKMREDIVNLFNITTDSELLEQIQDVLREREEILSVYEIVLVDDDPFIGTYRVGDTITINYKDDEDSFIVIDNEDFIVFGIDMAFNEDGVETTTLKVASVRPNTLQTDDVEKLLRRIDDAKNDVTELGK